MRRIQSGRSRGGGSGPSRPDGPEPSRRAFLGRLGIVALTGVLAGCSGGDGEPPTPTSTGSMTGSPRETTPAGSAATEPTPPGPERGDPTTAGATATASSTPTATATVEPTPTDTPTLAAYLAGANGYDGSITDATGRAEASVTVGAGDQGFRFAPAGIRIDAGTTVTWEWEPGARHNVVAADGSFDSGEPVVSDGKTFAHTFEGGGTWRYHCEPHRAVGMKGAVVVERPGRSRRIETGTRGAIREA